MVPSAQYKKYIKTQYLVLLLIVLTPYVYLHNNSNLLNRTITKSKAIHPIRVYYKNGNSQVNNLQLAYILVELHLPSSEPFFFGISASSCPVVCTSVRNPPS